MKKKKDGQGLGIKLLWEGWDKSRLAGRRAGRGGTVFLLSGQMMPKVAACGKTARPVENFPCFVENFLLFFLSVSEKEFSK